MDTRRWGDLKTRRSFQIVFLACFCLQQLQNVTASAEDYSPLLENQGLSESVADSRNKLESLSHLHPFNSEQDEGYKRSSSFFPLRGKKLSAADIDAAHYPFMSQQGDSDEKRSQFYPLRGKKIPDELKRGSYFMPMRGRKNDESWIEDDFQDDSLDKRMSSFMPMRGKKKSGLLDAFPHLGKPGTYPTEIMYPSSSGSNREKRASPFLVVQNEKESDDPLQKSHVLKDSSEENKMKSGTRNHKLQERSVSFMPMRGRRDLEPQEIKTRLIKKKEFSFVPMRGRRHPFNETMEDFPSDLIPGEESTTWTSQIQSTFNNIDSQNYKQSDNTNDKRASSFMPMRGRKAFYDNRDLMENDAVFPEGKRPSAFMPMRGRRKLVDDISSVNDHEIDTDKRPSFFMPMRGRRKLMQDVPNLDNHEVNAENKRASSFMPMRGRRTFIDYLNFRNYERDLYGKRASSFMPMRGRRLEDDPTTEVLIDSTGENMLTNEQNMDNLESSTDTAMDKKSSSFMPMRGRRNQSDNLTQALDDIHFDDKRGSYFMPMRGRRGIFDGTDSSYFFNSYPFIVPSGIGSSLMTRPYSGKVYPMSSVRRVVTKSKFDWDSVKRAFHATRGKRDHEDEKDLTEDWKSGASESSEQNQSSKSHNGKGCRYKRSILRPRVSLKPHRQYIALKRPMSFFATRGKRLDGSAIESVSKLY